MRRVLSLAGCGLLLIGCRPWGSAVPVHQRMPWLVGRWMSEDGSNVEEWKVDGHNLSATNHTFDAGELVYEERIELIWVGETLVYRAHPQGQASHDFMLEEEGEWWARFGDPGHDWPQTITYRREGNEMSATVAGTQDGERREETWSWQLATGR